MSGPDATLEVQATPGKECLRIFESHSNWNMQTRLLAPIRDAFIRAARAAPDKYDDESSQGKRGECVPWHHAS